MAGIDHRMYLQQQTPDFVGSAERGMRMGDLMRQRKLQEQQDAMAEAEKGLYSADASGNVALDGQKFGEFTKAHPQRAFEIQKQQRADDAARAEQQRQRGQAFAKEAAPIVMGINSPESHAAAVSWAKRTGNPIIGELGDQYDPKRVEALQNQARLHEEFLSREKQAREMSAKGYRLGSDGKSFEVIPGSPADFANRKILAEIQKLQAETGKTRAEAGAKSVGGFDRERFVPGIGETLTKDDAKQLKDAQSMKAKLDRQVQEMVDLRERYGTEFANRAAVARGQQLSRDLLLTYKNLAKLGVLSKSDEDIVEAIIPKDPLQMNASTFGVGEDPVLNNLRKFKGDLDAQYQSEIAARTTGGSAQRKSPVGGLSADEQAEYERLEALERAGKL